MAEAFEAAPHGEGGADRRSPGDVAAAALLETRRAHAAVQSAELGVLLGVLELGEFAVGGHKLTNYVAGLLGIPSKEASRRITAARKLQQLPVIAEALGSGRFTWSHVDVIARALPDRIEALSSEVQTSFVNLTEGATFEAWARDVRALIEHIDADGGHRPEQPNRFHMSRTMHDALVLEGVIEDGADAAQVEHLLREECDRLFAQWKADRKLDPELPVVPAAERLAQAVINLILRSRAVQENSHVPAGPTVVVTMEAAKPEELRTLDGRRLSEVAALKLLMNAVFQPLITDNDGVPLWLGRTRRFRSEEQARVAALRDGGCVFPGCTAPASWTHLHHSTPWGLLGPTDIDSMPLLCPHHHMVVHRRGWSIEPSRRENGSHDGWWILNRADGERFWSQRHGRQRRGAPPPPPPPSRSAAA